MRERRAAPSSIHGRQKRPAESQSAPVRGPTLPLPLLLAALIAAPACAQAVETSLSGFGTLGYAASNRPYAYQRFIDEDGTLKRDSVLGLQLDAQFGERFGATVQAKAAADPNNQHGVRAGVAWAFVSYRPSNAWLLRAGKFRLPLYLHSENLDVGTTFDLARLPAEVYSQVPTDDFKGASASRSWDLGKDVEATLDAYAGSSRTSVRVWIRDPIPGLQENGAKHLPITVKVKGLAFALRRGDDTLRLGYGRAKVASRSDVLFVRSYPFVQLAPGVGFYRTLDAIYDGSIPLLPEITVPLYTMALDVGLPGGVRIAAELGRRVMRDIELGYDTTSGYVAAFRRVGAFTPYVCAAVLRSSARNLRTYAALNDSRLPDALPFSPLINLLQRQGADTVLSFDQSSLAVGTSYALSPKSKLKVEWQQVRIGAVSALVDAPAFADVRHQNIRVLSLSYSFAF